MYLLYCLLTFCLNVIEGNLFCCIIIILALIAACLLLSLRHESVSEFTVGGSFKHLFLTFPGNSFSFWLRRETNALQQQTAANGMQSAARGVK